jgi:para-nitrobenzyl esterase
MARAGEIPNIPYIFGFTSNDMSDMTKNIGDFCLLREQQGKPAYAYLFTRQLPGDASGAFHSADLWYVFHSLRHSWRPFTKGDDAISLKIVDYWTNFAKYGDPNGKGAAEWTPYTASSPQFMVFDADDEKAIYKMTDTPEFLGRASLQ